MPTTNCIVTVQEEGRVTIPIEQRKYHGLKKGDLVQLQITKVSK